MHTESRMPMQASLVALVCLLSYPCCIAVELMGKDVEEQRLRLSLQKAEQIRADDSKLAINMLRNTINTASKSKWGHEVHAAALFQFAEMLERVIHFIVATSLKDLFCRAWVFQLMHQLQ